MLEDDRPRLRVLLDRIDPDLFSDCFMSCAAALRRAHNDKRSIKLRRNKAARNPEYMAQIIRA